MNSCYVKVNLDARAYDKLVVAGFEDFITAAPDDKSVQFIAYSRNEAGKAAYFGAKVVDVDYEHKIAFLDLG